MNTNKFRQWQPAVCITGLLLTMLFTMPRYSLASSDSAVINFSAVFAGGSCDISTSVSEIVFGGGELIAPADIVSSPPQVVFDLTFANCTGQGLAPKIKVTGESTTLFGPPLFRSPMPQSASDGYGILLSTNGNSTFSANANLADTKTITATNWDTNKPLSELDTTLPVTATLTCGTCDYAGRRSGDLISSVTFDFIYD